MKKMSLLALLSVLAFAVCGCVDSAGNGEKTDSGMADSSKDVVTEDRENAKPEMRGEIRISCFQRIEFLDTAAKQFMDQYPDVTVFINGYSDQSDTPREQEYQTSFNTELMSGDGADIIFNSFLPVTKYSEMGAFEDLSTYISRTPEMNDENYYMNVLKASQNDDGEIYLIPYKALIQTFGFSTELLKEHGDIENTLRGKDSIRFSEGMDFAMQLVEGKETGNNVFVIDMNPTEIMDYLIKDSLSDLIDQEKKEVRLDSKKYIDMLNSVKRIADGGWIDTSDIDFYNMEYSIAAYRDFDVQSAAFSIDSQSGISCFMPLADQKGNVAINTNSTCIALNSSSKHKELAWEFIKYLLSDEVQSLPSLYGLAVNESTNPPAMLGRME